MLRTIGRAALWTAGLLLIIAGTYTVVDGEMEGTLLLALGAVATPWAWEKASGRVPRNRKPLVRVALVLVILMTAGVMAVTQAG
jgi:hypothetical protein